MTKKVTVNWLESWDAEKGGIEWFESQKETDSVKLLKKLVRQEKLDYANCAISHCFNRKQKIQSAVFAAEQVIVLYEKECPDDDCLSKTIEAAKLCIDKNSKKNRDAANAAANAAAYAADAAAYAAAYAARIKILKKCADIVRKDYPKIRMV